MTVSEKLYFKIGEIADLLKINTSVLRFWETQFTELSPNKTKTGQRLYSRKDLELIKEIYRLLYGQKLTIAGAKAQLAQCQRQKKGGAGEGGELLQELCRELKDIRKLL